MISETHLEILLQKLGSLVKLHDTRSMASIIEQIIASGMNMTLSIAVVYSAGIAELGIFSFCLLIATLVSGFYQSLIHRQMLLHSSPEPDDVQNRNLHHAIAMNLLLFTTNLTIAIAIYHVYFFNLEENRLGLFTAVVIYILFFNLYDLLKKFLYIKNKQVYSLRCTLISTITTLLVIIIFLFVIPDNKIVTSFYLALAAGLVLGIISNNQCRKIVNIQHLYQPKETWAQFKNYWSQGKFGAIGMTIAWMQSQSLNPFLMWFSGATLAGYVSLARLFVMPITVVTQGLINSSTPSLRRTLENDGSDELMHRIKRLLKLTYVFTIAYLAVLLVLHFSNILETIVPEYTQVSFYIAFWSIFLIVSILRFWCGQYFLVQIKLSYLLKISIIAIVFFLAGISLTIKIFDDHFWFLFFMVASELLFSCLLLRQVLARSRT